jgi:hypothetical protein
MSVTIDNVGGATTFATITGTARTPPDNTSFAISTNFVQSVISALFTVGFNTGSLVIGTWTSILTNSIRTANTSSTNIRGSEINIGGASTTVKILGNTLNLDSDFTTILTGVNNMARFQAGYVTLAIGSTNYPPPNFVTGGSTSVHTTATASGITGYGGVTSPNLILRTTVAQEVNWLYFI